MLLGMKGWVLATALLIVSIGLSLVVEIKPKTNVNNLAVPTKVLLDPRVDLPCIWLFINDGDVNSRYWSDFGARSSRVLNKPYMNLCYETIVRNAGDRYRVEIIRGLSDAVQRLGDANLLPAPLRNSKAFLKDEEIQFIGIAFLAKFGGLWMSPSTVCIKEIPSLPKDKIIAFGTSDSETYSGKDGTRVPNTQYIWCPNAGTPMFNSWASTLYERLDSFSGGQRVRRDNQWDWLDVSNGACGVTTQPNTTLQRKANGRRIELEDLFASGTEGNLPFTISEDVIFVPIPYFELDRSSRYGWFLKSSESQILESDLAITYLFRMGLNQISE
jgi:hypothetical protein